MSFRQQRAVFRLHRSRIYIDAFHSHPPKAVDRLLHLLMEERPLKRRRGDVNAAPAQGMRPPAPVPETLDWCLMIDTLHLDALRAIVKQGVPESPSVRDLVCTYYDHARRVELAQIEHQRQVVIDFSHYSKEAWYVLNRKHKSGRGSVEYDRAYDAMEEVASTIEEISEQASGETSYGTKKSALETLRKIGKSIMLAPSTLGHEVRKHLQSNHCLEESMLEILENMTMLEIQSIAESEDEKGQFIDKLRSLWADAEGLCIMEDLSKVVQIFNNAFEDEEGVTDEETGDESDDGGDPSDDDAE